MPPMILPRECGKTTKTQVPNLQSTLLSKICPHDSTQNMIKLIDSAALTRWMQQNLAIIHSSFFPKFHSFMNVTYVQNITNTQNKTAGRYKKNTKTKKKVVYFKHKPALIAGSTLLTSTC